MNWFRNKDQERRILYLEGEVGRLRNELAEVRMAATMPVGTWNSYLNHYADTRSRVTAIEICQKLMADAGIEPHVVEAAPRRVDFFQQTKEESK